MLGINKKEYENEKIKIKQNQERLDNIENIINTINNEFPAEKEKVAQNQRRLDFIENVMNVDWENEKTKVAQNQKRLDIMENQCRGMMRELDMLYHSKQQGNQEEKFSFLNKRTNSQSGEDAILAYVISRVGIGMNECRYLDLGANRPIEGSNTNFFYQRGATGVLVEANPQLIPALKEQRDGDVILNKCIDSKEGTTLKFYIMSDDGLSTPNQEQVEEIQKKNPDVHVASVVDVESITVNQIMQSYFEDSAPQIMSIDVEGKDLEILQSIDFSKYRPFLIVIEMIEYSVESVSLTRNVEILNYMESQGYQEYAFTGINSIFIDKSSDYLR